MANPFLVLGGVAVGVITAGIGVLQVPGWIDSANDSAARNDLAQVALAQEASNTTAGVYLTELELTRGQILSTAAGGSGGSMVNEKTGVEFQPSDGVELAIYKSSAGTRWVAIAQSKSGKIFVRTSDGTTVYASQAKYEGSEQARTLELYAPGSASSLAVTVSGSNATVASANYRYTLTGTAPSQVSQTIDQVLGSGTTPGTGVTVP